MTLFNKSFNPKINGSLYSARAEAIRTRDALIRKHGAPPNRVWFSIIEENNVITLYLRRSLLITPEAHHYINNIAGGVFAAIA